jgi:DNA invertase Pin-like site-specific DNA recombinase
VSQQPDTAAYLRVSTTRQETKLQLRAILDWLKGQSLSRQSIRWYKDKGASSDAKSRPAWDRLMDDVRGGRVKRILCWKIDRLNRWGPKDHLRFRLELDQYGVEVLSLTEGDTAFDSDLDVIREVIQSKGRADWLKAHRERIRSGVRLSIQKHGTWGRGRLPESQRGRKLTEDQERAIRASTATVRQLAAEYNVGRSTIQRVRSGTA